MGEEFIVLTVACLLLGTAAVACDSPAVYGLAVLTCGLAVAAYIATRVLAFPLLADDVGNWLEPLGVLSVLAETVAVGLAGRVLLASVVKGEAHPSADEPCPKAMDRAGLGP